MGTQIRIEVNAKYSDFVKPLITYYNVENNTLSKPITFNEYVKKGVTILIQAPASYYLKVEVPHRQEEIIVYPDNLIEIIPPNEDGIIPGEFPVSLFNNETLQGTFNYTIQPTSGAYSQILELREYLESIANGLSRDIYVMGKTSINQGLSIAENDLEKLQYLYNNYNIISKTIETIINYPLCNITKKNKISHNIKSISNKSIIWLNQQQNNCLNKSAPEKLLQSFTCLSNNIIENKMLKSILLNILEEISIIECNISNKIGLIREYYEINKKQIEDTQKEENKIKNEYGFKKATKSKQNKIHNIEEENKKNIERIYTLQKNFHKIKTLKLIFCRILRESFLANLEPNFKICFTKQILKSPEYYYIFDMYFKITNSKNKVSVNNNYSYQFKPTDKLVEYYCLDLVIKILIKSFKFYWKSGWLANLNRIDNDIESGDVLVFKKNNITIKVSYDRIVPHYYSIKTNYNGVVTKVINTNNKPDILLEIFLNDTLQSYIVFECKHRKTKYIYNKYTSTDVQEQLTAYDNFTSAKNVKAQISKQVVCLYTLGNKAINSNNQLIEYIGVKFSNVPDETSTYNDIKKVISEYIKLPEI